MHATDERSSKRQTLNIRIKSEDRGLIDRAARASGKTRTDFILDAARRAAENTLLEQTLIRVGPDAFNAFLARLDAPRNHISGCESPSACIAYCPHRHSHIWV